MARLKLTSCGTAYRGGPRGVSDDFRGSLLSNKQAPYPKQTHCNGWGVANCGQRTETKQALLCHAQAINSYSTSSEIEVFIQCSLNVIMSVFLAMFIFILNFFSALSLFFVCAVTVTV